MADLPKEMHPHRKQRRSALCLTNFAVINKKQYGKVCKYLIKNTSSCQFVKVKIDNESETNG